MKVSEYLKPTGLVFNKDSGNQKDEYYKIENTNKSNIEKERRVLNYNNKNNNIYDTGFKKRVRKEITEISDLSVNKFNTINLSKTSIRRDFFTKGKKLNFENLTKQIEKRLIKSDKKNLSTRSHTNFSSSVNYLKDKALTMSSLNIDEKIMTENIVNSLNHNMKKLDSVNSKHSRNSHNYYPKIQKTKENPSRLIYCNSTHNKTDLFPTNISLGTAYSNFNTISTNAESSTNRKLSTPMSTFSKSLLSTKLSFKYQGQDNRSSLRTIQGEESNATNENYYKLNSNLFSPGAKKKDSGNYLEILLKDSNPTLKKELFATRNYFRSSYEFRQTDANIAMKNIFYNKIGAPALKMEQRSIAKKFRSSIIEQEQSQEPVKQTPQIKKKFRGSLGKPLFNDKMKLNKFLIRDFNIGDSIDPIKNSKNKLKMTINMYDTMNAEKKEKAKQAREAFEIEKYGAVILEEENLDNSINDQDINNIYSNLNEHDRNKIALKQLDEDLKHKIKENSKKKAKMIHDISNGSYEEIKIEKESFNLISTLISRKNMERIIRVRSILKTGKDADNDNLGIEDMDKFKEHRQMLEQELSLALKNMGPPSFLKTNFKLSTIEKYKMVNGKYFGCNV